MDFSFVDVLTRLARVSLRNVPYMGQTCRRRQRRVQLESLERRDLLATIPFGPPTPLNSPDPLRFGYPDSPISIEQTGRVTVRHAWADEVDLEATEFEYSSKEDELILFQLDGDGIERDMIEIVDADSEHLSGWSIFEIGRQASTFHRQGKFISLQERLTEHIWTLERLGISIDAWRSGATWIVGETSEAGVLKLRVPASSQESGIYARAYTGLKFLNDDSEAPHPIDINWDAESESRDSVGIAGRIGVADAETVQFTENFESNEEDLAKRLTVRTKNDGTVRIESSSESNHSLFLETRTPEPIEYIDGILIEYNSTTGDLSFQAATPVRAIEFTSETGLFGGPIPEIIADNVFNVFRPTKLFTVVLQGASEIDFGPVLPTGLTREVLEQDLTIEGVYVPTGGMNQIVVSVDGEISFSTAETESFTPETIALTSSASARLAVAHGDILSFDYSLASTIQNPDRTQTDQPYAGVRFTSNNRPLLRRALKPCESVCHAEFWMPSNHDESVQDVQITFENTLNDVRLEIDNIETKSTIDQTQVFEITAHAGQTLAVDFSLFGNMQASLRDSAGQLVTTSDSFELAGPTHGAELYQLRLFATAPMPASYFMTVDSEPSSSRISERQFSTRLSNDQLTVQWPFPIDLRTCKLRDFDWDGPDFDRIGYNTNGDVSLTTISPVEEGYYTLSIRDGACVSPARVAAANRTVDIDFVPPKLVGFPLRDRQWIKPGVSSFSLRFDERILQWADGTGTQVERFDGTLQGPVFLSPMRGNFVLGRFGNLAPGEYRLKLDFAVGDGSGNQLSPHLYDFSFVVSDTPPDGVIDNRFDLDGNGSVDHLDLDFLRAMRSTYGPNASETFDLNNDNKVNEADVDLLLREGLKSRMGDVDLDGDFDQDDLDFLASLQKGSRTDSRWTLGDFNGDGLFDSADMVLAFKDGNVEED